MQGVHPDRVETFMKKSLENLQLDYVDLYLVHFPVGFKCDESTLRPKLDDKNQMIPESKTDHLGIWKVRTFLKLLLNTLCACIFSYRQWKNRWMLAAQRQ